MTFANVYRGSTAALLNDPDPAARVARVSAAILANPSPEANVYRVSVSALVDGKPPMDIYRIAVSALVRRNDSGTNIFRVSAPVAVVKEPPVGRLERAAVVLFSRDPGPPTRTERVSLVMLARRAEGWGVFE